MYCYLATKPEVQGFRAEFCVTWIDNLRVQSLWLLKTGLGRSQTSVYQSWIARHTFTLCVTHILLAQSMVARSIQIAMLLYIHIYIECGRHIRGKITLWGTVRGESGVAGEGRVVGVPKFHSWGKCTLPVTNINSDWMCNASSGLRINLFIYIILFMRILYFASWGVIYYASPLSCILGCD